MSILSLFEGKTPEEIGGILTGELDSFVKARIEEALNDAFGGEIEDFIAEWLQKGEGAVRNGHYERHLKTKYGPVAVRVPRDRMNLFKTRLLQPYQRSTDDLEATVQRLCIEGMTLSEITAFLKGDSDLGLSAESAAKMVRKMAGEADAFRSRPLPRCVVVLMDGTYVPIRRRYGDSSSIEKECIEVAMGVTEDGKRVILGFRTVPNEGSSSWGDFLERLKARGIGDPKLFITDGLQGMPEAIAASFPAAKQQRCLVHIQRSISKAVRVKDRKEIAEDFKSVYGKADAAETFSAFDAFLSKWGRPYPKLMSSLIAIKGALFAYLRFPKCMRSAIMTSNAIESFNSCLKRQTRRRVIINSETNGLIVMCQVIKDYEQNSRGAKYLKYMGEEEKQKLGFK